MTFSFRSLELGIPFLNIVYLIPKASASPILTNRSRLTPTSPMWCFPGVHLYCSFQGPQLFQSTTLQSPEKQNFLNHLSHLLGPPIHSHSSDTVCESTVLHPKAPGVCDESPSLITNISQPRGQATARWKLLST